MEETQDQGIERSEPTAEMVAAVDLGSQSFHLVLARVQDGQPVVIDRLREMVQLASGLDDELKLSPEARERALDCLRRFGQRLRHVAPEAVRAVGTNTLRSAHDAEEFLLLASEALGHSIETISGIEEARLIYTGVAHTLAESPGNRLVLDIGGGSTEVIIGEGYDPLMMQSLYLGCVTLSRRYFEDGELSLRQWEKAELAARQEFAPVQSGFRRLGWTHAAGSSGTIRAVGAVLEALGIGGGKITPRSVAALREAILEAGQVKRLKLEGLSPRRRLYFPGGVVVLHVALEALEIERLEPAEGALREGLLYDLLGRIREEDVRNRSVSALAERYHVDREQAQRVAVSALGYLAQVEEEWRLKDKLMHRLLAWAAELHEIGLDIAHSHYHKHGQYVAARADLHGFSMQEQQMLAVLIRAHRRKFPIAELEQLPPEWARSIERLAILLRLAVLLHRGRGPDPLPALQLEPGKRSLEVAFPDGWLDEHPLSRADLEQEAGYLKAAGHRLTVRAAG